MTTTLVIGGTGFVGHHTVEEFLEHGYDVTTVSCGTHDMLFSDRLAVTHAAGDRIDDDVLTDVARRVEPDVVIDCAAFHPHVVRTAIEIFADAEAYVYVSSGAV